MFRVRAHSAQDIGQDRTSDARITIKIQYINDNPPVFQQSQYEKYINESMLPGSPVLVVSATDQDTNIFGGVRCPIDGEGSDVFTIQNETELIQVKPGQLGRSHSDREKQPVFKLKVLTTDMKGEGRPEQLSTRVDFIMHIQDVYDSPPRFSRTTYPAAVLENSKIENRRISGKVNRD